MTTQASRTPTYAGRLGAATLLATAALLGTTTGTLGDSAIVCAEPINRGWLNICMDDVDKRFEKGEITEEQRDKQYEACCITAGGVWREVKPNVSTCSALPENYEYPAPPVGQLPQIPGPTEATRVPPPPAPPAGPVVTLPSVPPVQTR